MAVQSVLGVYGTSKQPYASFAGKAEAAAAVGGGVLVSYTQPADFTRLTGLLPFLWAFLNDLL